MTTRLLAPSLALAVGLAAAACDAGTKPADQGNPGPQLSIVAPRMDHVYRFEDDSTKSETVEVLLDLKNYVIGEAKKGADGKYEAGTGQHVHLILDNGAYDAKYDVSKAITLDPKLLTAGTHVLRAFPSAGPADGKGARWHEARKNAGAFAWVRFHVGKKGGDLADFDGTKPLLTYSRPKGSYALGSPDKALLFPLMLDFYVTGCTLSKDGYRVQATIDGKSATMLPDGKTLVDVIDEWKPQSIQPDPAVGDHTIVLQLIDEKGKPVEGPFNRTERTIKISEK